MFFSSTMVSMTTGISASSGSAFRACRTLQPSRPGISTSSVISAGCSWRASASPSSPSWAVTTSKPSRARKRRIRSRTVCSSSITRILPVVRPPWGPCTIGSAGTQGAGVADCGAAAGRRTAKVEPTPGVLSTAMLPPRRWQSRRLIASPRPVPPYRRVVELSAWLNSSNTLAICSAVMPMPLSATVKVNQAPSGRSRSTVSATSPFSVNLQALLSRLRIAHLGIELFRFLPPSGLRRERPTKAARSQLRTSFASSALTFAAMDLKLCRSLSARPSAGCPSVQLPALGPVWLSRCRQGRRREQGRCQKAPPIKAGQTGPPVERPHARGRVSAPVRPS